MPIYPAVQFMTTGGTLVGNKVRLDGSDAMANPVVDAGWYMAENSGSSIIRKFGENDDLDTALETVWDVGGLYPWNAFSAATLLDVVSDEVEDVFSGTGARVAELQGLDANFNKVTENVNLSGTIAVSTTLQFRRLFRIKVLSAGTQGSNEGTVTASHPDGTTLAQVSATKNQTLMALWTVPSGKTMYMVDVYFNGGVAQRTIHAELYIRSPNQVFQLKRHFKLYESSIIYTFPFPLVVSSTSDIEIRAESSGVNGQLAAGFSGYYK